MKHLKKKLKPLRYLLEYIAGYTAYFLLRVMPQKMLFFTADIAGFILYCIPSCRNLIIANLKVAFPRWSDSKIRSIARKNTTSTVLTVMEFLWFVDRRHKLARKAYFNHDADYLTDKFIEEGKGAIWATPHLGNWEVAGLKFKDTAGIPFAVVVRTMNNPYFDRLINSGRMSEGSRVIRAKGAVKGMMKALKDGYFVATLIDQNTRARDGGVFVDFFGLPVCTSRAPALFARKMDVPVAVGGCVRRGYKYETFAKALPKSTSEYKSDEELIQDIMLVTEGIIRKFPEQYLWMYERWRYIPEDIDEPRKERYPFYADVVSRRFFDEKAPKQS